MRRGLVLSSCLLLLLVAGCSDGGGAKKTSSTTTTKARPRTTTTTTAATSSSSPSTTAPCNFAGTTAPQQNNRPADPMLLTNVRSTANGCLDVITFDFRSSGVDAAPGYASTYEKGPFRQEASGQPVSVAGQAFLVIRFEPAATADLSNGGQPTYTGSRSITPTALNHVQQIELIGDFEGVVTWVIGLDEERPLQTSATAGPPTLTLTVG